MSTFAQQQSHVVLHVVTVLFGLIIRESVFSIAIRVVSDSALVDVGAHGAGHGCRLFGSLWLEDKIFIHTAASVTRGAAMGVAI